MFSRIRRAGLLATAFVAASTIGATIVFTTASADQPDASPLAPTENDRGFIQLAQAAGSSSTYEERVAEIQAEIDRLKSGNFEPNEEMEWAEEDLLYGEVESAYEVFTRYARQGYARAEYNLGYIHKISVDAGWTDIGFVADYEQAIVWFRIAADKDYARAQHYLGIMYRDGKGLPKDSVEACMWFILATSEPGPESLPETRKVNVDLHRDLTSLREEMTSSQVSQAEKLAREWANENRT